MDRLISLQAAMDAVKEAVISAEWEYAKEALERLPSAQPDSKELSSTHKTLDTISRQAAIYAAQNTICGDTWEVDQVIYALKELPSAQPEDYPGR